MKRRYANGMFEKEVDIMTPIEEESNTCTECEDDCTNEKVKRAPYIRITLTDNVLFAEFKRLQLEPYNVMFIHANQVLVLEEDGASEKQLMLEYCALHYLHRKNVSLEDSCSIIVSIRAFEMFVAHQYGLRMFHAYKDRGNVETGIGSNAMRVREVKGFENAEEVSEVFRESVPEDVEIYSERYGVLGIPPEDMMNTFFGNVRLYGGCFLRYCRERILLLKDVQGDEPVLYDQELVHIFRGPQASYASEAFFMSLYDEVSKKIVTREKQELAKRFKEKQQQMRSGRFRR